MNILNFVLGLLGIIGLVVCIIDEDDRQFRFIVIMALFYIIHLIGD